MTKEDTAKAVYKALHDLGYKAEILDEETVGSAASGLRFIVQSYDENIQFRCLLNSVDGEEIDLLKFANEFNFETRFSKIYMDDDKDLIIELDCWINSDLDERNTFSQAVDLWELSLSALKERLRKYYEQINN